MGKKNPGAMLQPGSTELAFEVHAGTRNFPPWQVVTITGNAGWVARPDSAWIVSKEDLKGVSVTVNPRGLAAGKHTGSVLIIAADGSYRCEIRVQVSVKR
jgi:hypothetical protein